MAVAQLSFWDNESLERGYRCLADLELEEAVQHFNHALQSGLGSEIIIGEAIAACHYWQPRIKKHEITDSYEVTALLTDYRQYPFTRLLSAFKKSLIGYLADCLLKQHVHDWNEMESVFNLLLESEAYQKAQDFIALLIDKNTEKKQLLYFLAQAQWHNENKVDANDNYILALLHHPDKLFIDRVENKKLQGCISEYGPAMAPAYCLLLGIVPVVAETNHIEIRDEEHAGGIRSLRLLREVNKTYAINDKAHIMARKKLKAENQALFDVYITTL